MSKITHAHWIDKNSPTGIGVKKSTSAKLSKPPNIRAKHGM